MIKINRLYKTYDRHKLNANTVLHDISVTLPDTGFVCILGPSGCGKTSLLNAIGGLDKFDRGTIEAGKTRVRRYGTRAYEVERNRSFGYIFQNYYLLMEHSVAYNVYLGLHNLRLSHRAKLKRVAEALKAVEMDRYLRRTVGELSGGQQQRVAIARALARKPRVIFADEPTGNLDEANTLNICSLLRRISKTSLVVMVTHEERIANFFADRIITLKEGRISGDEENWERSDLTADTGKTLYAGDYPKEVIEQEGLNLRFLRQEGAEPVQLTVLALKDRVIIKLADGRTVSCGTPAQAPELKEGKRPVLTLESLDNEAGADDFLSTQPQKHMPAGWGVSLPMQWREAKTLSKGKGLRRASMKVFLVLLALLTAFTVSDYLTVASIDPEEFITVDSHILEIEVGQGSAPNPTSNYTIPKIREFLDYLKSSGQDYDFIPHVALTAEYSLRLMPQLDSLSMNFGAYSYAPIDRLDESTLIAGRMPRNSEEIVIDRWLLDAASAEEGIIQNSIHDSSYFLGRQITYPKRTYAPTVVGICDSGEPAIYMDTAGMISIGVGGVSVMPLSELRQLYPEYAGVTLADNECLVNAFTAGETFHHRVGGTYATSQRLTYIIRDAIEVNVGAHIIVDDSQIDLLQEDMYSSRFYLYCADKEAMLELLAKEDSPGEQAGYTRITVTNRYDTDMAAYQEATNQKLDARAIVTVTVIALSMVMLYLLCRAQTQERIGMLAVYRLLGIPKRKLMGIFAMESIRTSLGTALPGTAAVWLAIYVLSSIEEVGLGMVFPWQAALAVYGGILVYHLLVSLLPSRRLLRLPPAQLAAKYDL